MSAEMSIRICVNDKIVDISELKVADLKVELKKRGLSCTGNPAELHDKLRNVRFAFSPSLSLSLYRSFHCLQVSVIVSFCF